MRKRLLLPGVALLSVLGCSDLFTWKPDVVPPDVPGDSIQMPNICAFAGCLTWSGDSRTLFVGTTDGLYRVTPDTRVAAKLAMIGIPERAASSQTGDVYHYAVAEGAGKYAVYEMMVASRVTRSIATASRREFAVAPDGLALAYVTERGPGVPDTVVVLDLSTGARRGSMTGGQLVPLAFSGSGEQLAVWEAGTGGGAASVRIWNIDTGALESNPVPLTPTTLFEAMAWVDGSFRALLRTNGRLLETDHTFTLEARYDSAVVGPHGVSWVPGRRAAFAAVPLRCYETESSEAGCTVTTFGLAYVTIGSWTTPGSVNTYQMGIMSASPDGQWLAHVSYFLGNNGYRGPLYLLHHPVAASP